MHISKWNVLGDLPVTGGMYESFWLSVTQILKINYVKSFKYFPTLYLSIFSKIADCSTNLLFGVDTKTWPPILPIMSEKLKSSKMCRHKMTYIISVKILCFANLSQINNIQWIIHVCLAPANPWIWIGIHLLWISIHLSCQQEWINQIMIIVESLDVHFFACGDNRGEELVS